MAGFDFSKADQFSKNDDKDRINFLKIEDDGWYAKVRFMYNDVSEIRCETVHNVSTDPKKPKNVVCLREEGMPIDACPLCVAGSKVQAQFYVPVYVESIVSVVRGVEQEQPVGQVQIFRRGSTFKNAIGTIIRNTKDTGKPIVNSLFRLVRNGEAGNQKTTYSVEYIRTDEVLPALPKKPEVVGSYVLPKYTPEEMIAKFINGQEQPQQIQARPVDIQPRTLNANTFAGNTIVTQSQPIQTQTFSQPINANQAPINPLPIGGNGTANTPF